MFEKKIKLTPLPAEKKLEEVICAMDSIAIAFSGGLDSTMLALFASHFFTHEKLLLIHVDTGTSPVGEEEYCIAFAEKYSLRMHKCKMDIIKNPLVRINDLMRCYHCKKMLMEKALSIATEHGMKTLCDGANTDDFSDWRPGMKASDELAVRHPFIEAGIDKNLIRLISRRMGLDNYMRASSACMASRIPTGTPLEPVSIAMARTAEDILKKMGFPFARVRIPEENSAYIEVRTLYLGKLERMFPAIIHEFEKIGFERIEINRTGYRQGAMNTYKKENP